MSITQIFLINQFSKLCREANQKNGNILTNFAENVSPVAGMDILCFFKLTEK